uniref:Uncharacterized protein n=1 Tax=Zea mays TaxID=4577 RepID=C4J2W8_MAIZE|nr:unknown [Zea mays]
MSYLSMPLAISHASSSIPTNPYALIITLHAETLIIFFFRQHTKAFSARTMYPFSPKASIFAEKHSEFIWWWNLSNQRQACSSIPTFTYILVKADCVYSSTMKPLSSISFRRASALVTMPLIEYPYKSVRQLTTSGTKFSVFIFQ